MAKLNARDEARRAARELDGSNHADYSEALERGLLVLTAFEHTEERLSQAQLARKLELPRATVRRALLTLTHLGYVIPDDKAYRLGPKVLTLASAYLTTNPVSHVLQPVCDRLAEEFRASCTAAVLDGAAAVMIARGLPRHTLPIGQGVGFRVPALRSALGLVLLGALDEERRHRHLVTHSDGDEEAVAALERKIAEVAAAGRAYVAHDVEAGFHSTAVPLRRWDGTVIAALNVGATLERISSQEMRERVLPVLLETADRLQAQLV
ncbi:IclR family transcriptional regulator C-terminal domain-containing protein [Actinomadura nitritigenes]|uniref:Helix-turn-helix domain-containing protein n=1 Tax=Actinomadura nitritigenes TaxID=134602 RepID=A0ABS3R9F5_9ACTN|nr:helix-turn-helix domain-containing protein [Actinomadura nitritigenes]MBO2442682.1 helix-turn-helix domain-containing protein [Actinomadura nitritigenes]